jgi:hypothetical protein
MGVHYGPRPEGNNPYVPTFFSATGGVITFADGYTYHTFSSSGTFTVVSGSATVEVVAWGGGGGGGGGGPTANGSLGGAGGTGGFARSLVPVTPQNYLIAVGTGGAGGVFALAATAGGAGGTPGGGEGGLGNGSVSGNSGCGSGGGGGGHSAFATLVIGAGGGGGGGGDNNSAASASGVGGTGGGASATAGTSSGISTGGGAGTQLVGGTGGTSAGVTGSTLAGGAGGAGTGDIGRAGGGGGGSGYFGGGGGGGVVSAGVGGGGGGGGSGFGNAFTYFSGVTVPSNIGTAGLAGALQGNGGPGNNGVVIVRYLTSGSLVPPNVTFVEFVRNVSTNTTQTTSINLGPEATGRRIYVLFLYSNNSSSSVNSFSINGVPGTIVWNQSSTGLNTSATAHAVGVVELPTGTTGSLITTFSGLFSGPSYAIYNVVGDTAPIGSLFDGQTILSASAISNPSISCSVQQFRFAFIMLSTGQSTEVVNSVTNATYDGASANFRFVSHAENFSTSGTTNFTYNLATVADAGYRITAVSF